ncbi:transmembrane protein 242 isoform X1 [Hippoglossus hippoglossus]|uniref:transmembrane protein 242 isoform X1 n=1 Tax=Hippoglossus hippoglossus TaxID=8267 RepID=UPI00148E7596|nr:transmembrane protein 242 isoform X1 [Hippoglossus hippoglossus]
MKCSKVGLFPPGDETLTDRSSMAAEGSAEETTREEVKEKRQMIHGAAFLTTVASAGLVAGFGSTLALVKRKNPDWFNKGAVPALPESGAALALRALGWGSLFAWCGVGLLSVAVWKVLDVHSLSEFRLKMQSVFPSIPKSAEATAGSEPLDWDSVFKSK